MSPGASHEAVRAAGERGENVNALALRLSPHGRLHLDRGRSRGRRARAGCRFASAEGVRGRGRERAAPPGCGRGRGPPPALARLRARARARLHDTPLRLAGPRGEAGRGEGRPAARGARPPRPRLSADDRRRVPDARGAPLGVDGAGGGLSFGDLRLARKRASVAREQEPALELWSGASSSTSPRTRETTPTPFAFLATYATRVSGQGRVQHLPLGRALEEYAGAARQDALSRSSARPEGEREEPLVKELVDSGELFHPLAWKPAEAYRFLKEVPPSRRAASSSASPTGGTRASRPRPEVRVTVGDEGLGGRGGSPPRLRRRAHARRRAAHRAGDRARSSRHRRPRVSSRGGGSRSTARSSARCSSTGGEVAAGRREGRRLVPRGNAAPRGAPIGGERAETAPADAADGRR